MCAADRVHETVPAVEEVIIDNMRGAASGAPPSSLSIKVGRTRITVTSLVTVRYNEGSCGGEPGAATTTTTTGTAADPGGSVEAVGAGLALAPSSRMSPPSSMDTSEGPAVALVKAETPEVQHRPTTSVPTASGPVGGGSGLFAGIASSNKRPRPDDWLAPNSPNSPQGPLPGQHLIYTTPQQQLSGNQSLQQPQVQTQQPQQQPSQQSAQQPQAQTLQQSQQQQQPPMAHSTSIPQPPVQQQPQQPPPNNNGYASPMSSGSYDPYSPNGKIGK